MTRTISSSALKKIFGRVHTPMEGQQFLASARRDRPRRRMRFHHVRVNEDVDSFVSRPGVFGYGFATKAETEVMELTAGQRA